MDCSMREALRIEPSIAPTNALFGAIGMHRGENSLQKRFFSVFQKQLDFLQAKEWFFLCLVRHSICGTFRRFIPCNLSRLSPGQSSSQTERYELSMTA